MFFRNLQLYRLPENWDMTGELHRLIPALIDALGGEVQTV